MILRHKQLEVPFSPDGPLTWGEIDLVRTDVFTPALAGLLPDRAVRVGDRWNATPAALQELTDLETIDDGGLECTLAQFTTLANRRHARLDFRGTVRGVGEDGANRQQLEGTLLFDQESNHISYLSMRGVQTLLDKDGRAAGQVEGTFVLTRQPRMSPDLRDEIVGSLRVEPNDDNTLLLFEDEDLGVRLLYPRRWHVAGVRGKQVALDEKQGSGLLLTLEPLARVPTGQQFLDESRARCWDSRKRPCCARTAQQRFQAARAASTVSRSMSKRTVNVFSWITTSSARAMVGRRLRPDFCSRIERGCKPTCCASRSVELTRKQ